MSVDAGGVAVVRGCVEVGVNFGFGVGLDVEIIFLDGGNFFIICTGDFFAFLAIGFLAACAPTISIVHSVTTNSANAIRWAIFIINKLYYYPQLNYF